MKTYTDIKASKKLAEILPLESADMWLANGIVVDYEKKYKETIEKFRAALAPKNGCEISGLTRDCVEEIFPELKDSEDERIRKKIIEAIKEDMSIGTSKDKKLALAWLEKQGEQKTVDKVEPKFKEGDWVVTDKSNVVQIKSIDNNHYVLENTMRFAVDYVDKCWRGWTIADAKDGDILYEDFMEGFTFIYNGVNEENAILYSFLINNEGKDVLHYNIGKPNTGLGYIEEHKSDIKPATKEQCDFLLQKMREAEKIAKEYKEKGYDDVSIRIEQKSADEVKPKFRVGDFIINDKGITYKIIGVSDVIDNEYRLRRLFDNGSLRACIKSVDKLCHIWTIQDAKYGDVLIDEDIDLIGIFEGIEGMCWHSKIYYSDNTKQLYGAECGGSHQKEFAKPATKEQRDLLFRKMKEAGYEWDAEKKEVKKIEQESIEIPFGAKDSELQEATYYIPEGFHAEIDGDKVVIKKGEQKPAEWSEEDNFIINELVSFLENGKAKLQHDLNIYAGWLKSLRPQNNWKPSDEQMEALANALSLAKNCGEESSFDLRKLYEQLKKLTE